jgi:glutaredoxin-related protein
MGRGFFRPLAPSRSFKAIFFGQMGCPHCAEAKEGILHFNLFRAGVFDHIEQIDISNTLTNKVHMLQSMMQRTFPDGMTRVPALVTEKLGVISSNNPQHYSALLYALRKKTKR